MQIFLFRYNALPSMKMLATVLIFSLSISADFTQGWHQQPLSQEPHYEDPHYKNQQYKYSQHGYSQHGYPHYGGPQYQDPRYDPRFGDPQYQDSQYQDPRCEYPQYSEEIKFSSPEECARQCQDGEPPRYCQYNFTLEYFTAFGRACDFCEPPAESSGINEWCECILGDGFEKTVFSLNRQIPGPSIQVCLRDHIIVDVKNEAEGLEASIHWHGLFQRGSQYYDGVPYLTQCPILSANTFRYQFQANNAGTHLYHSHISVQMIDGQYGSLIVRNPPSEEPHYDEYDEDRPEHVMVLSDWFHELSLERFPGRYRSDIGQVAQNILINGRGQWRNPETNESNDIPLAMFTVQYGRRYRFRIINAFSTVCLCEVSIEGHDMNVIAMDGENVEITEVQALTMATGERVDVVINAVESPGYYWIHVRGLGECEVEGVYQLAFLVYEDAPTSTLSPTPGYFMNDNTRIFNPPNATECSNNVCVDQMRKKYLPDEYELPLNTRPHKTVIMAFDFFNYTAREWSEQLLFNSQYYNEYSTFFVAADQSHLVSMINGLTNQDPPGPAISQDMYTYLCGSHYTPATCTTPCSCTHIFNFALGDMVDVMIYDKRPLISLNHPFHLHGYSFCVLDSGQFINPQDPDNISDDDVNRVLDNHEWRLDNDDYKFCAPKDTVIVPNTGYVILRFLADNPGWWFFHCHFSWHTASGMNVVFHVGEPWDLPPIPEGFPQCNDWTPPVV